MYPWGKRSPEFFDVKGDVSFADKKRKMFSPDKNFEEKSAKLDKWQDPFLVRRDL